MKAFSCLAYLTIGECSLHVVLPMTMWNVVNIYLNVKCFSMIAKWIFNGQVCTLSHST